MEMNKSSATSQINQQNFCIAKVPQTLDKHMNKSISTDWSAQQKIIDESVILRDISGKRHMIRRKTSKMVYVYGSMDNLNIY